MAEKVRNISFSPYNYVTNNPILKIDPDGRDWGVSINTDKNGVLNIKFTFTAAVLNQTQNKKLDAQMKKLATSIEKQLEKSYSGQSNSVKFSMDAHIRVIDDKKDLKKDEHLFMVRNDQSVAGVYGRASDLNGNGKIGGKGILLNEKFIGGIISGADNNTIPHEVGHTGGLLHPDKNNRELMFKFGFQQIRATSAYDNDNKNIMYSNQAGGINVNDAISTEVSSFQAKVIAKNISENKVNDN